MGRAAKTCFPWLTGPRCPGARHAVFSVVAVPQVLPAACSARLYRVSWLAWVPGAGEVDVPLTGPGDDGLVEELRAVVEVQTRDGEGDFLHARLQGGQDVDVRVVAHRAGENPPGVHAGQVQGPGELALQRRPTVLDGVALEKPRLGFDLVTGLTDLDRGPQQR